MNKKNIIKMMYLLLFLGCSFIMTNLVQTQLTDKISIIINDDLYQYYDNVRYDYIGKKEITTSEDMAIMQTEGEELIIDSIPLYYSDEHKAMLPKSMLYFNTTEKSMSRIDFHSMISIEDGSLIVSRDDVESNISSGFLYDGMDTYILLDTMTIQIDDEKIKLEPMSYINVSFNNMASLYIYNEEKCIMISSEDYKFENLIISSENGYGIKLNNDVYIDNSGIEILILNNVNLLEPLI